MRFVSSLGFVCLLVALWFVTMGEVCSQVKTNKNHDVYAGKVVKDFKFGQGLILERMKNAPRLGQRAPDFILKDAASGQVLQLSALCKSKPVVLMFGSSTCNETGRSIEPIAELSKKYANKVQFVLVYIREAHAQDGLNFGMKGNINDPKSYEERQAVAAAWKKRKKIPFPVVVDGMGDAMAVRWAGWPVRLYVIDQQQKVIYAGQQGPWYYNPGEWYQHSGKVNIVSDEDRIGLSKGGLEEFLGNYLGYIKAGGAPALQ